MISEQWLQRVQLQIELEKMMFSLQEHWPDCVCSGQWRRDVAADAVQATGVEPEAEQVEKLNLLVYALEHLLEEVAVGKDICFMLISTSPPQLALKGLSALTLWRSRVWTYIQFRRILFRMLCIQSLYVLILHGGIRIEHFSYKSALFVSATTN